MATVSDADPGGDSLGFETTATQKRGRAYQDIVETLYRYASCIDERDFVGLRALFADDAAAQYAGGEWLRGADAIVSWIEQMTLDRAWQHHHLSVYSVDLDGDEARTLTSLISHKATKANPDAVTVTVGRYRDVLRQSDGAWKIAEKVMESPVLGGHGLGSETVATQKRP